MPHETSAYTSAAMTRVLAIALPLLTAMGCDGTGPIGASEADLSEDPIDKTTYIVDEVVEWDDLDDVVFFTGSTYFDHETSGFVHRGPVIILESPGTPRVITVDFDLMRKGARVMVGRFDGTSFSRAHCRERRLDEYDSETSDVVIRPPFVLDTISEVVARPDGSSHRCSSSADEGALAIMVVEVIHYDPLDLFEEPFPTSASSASFYHFRPELSDVEGMTNIVAHPHNAAPGPTWDPELIRWTPYTERETVLPLTAGANEVSYTSLYDLGKPGWRWSHALRGTWRVLAIAPDGPTEVTVEQGYAALFFKTMVAGGSFAQTATSGSTDEIEQVWCIDELFDSSTIVLDPSTDTFGNRSFAECVGAGVNELGVLFTRNQRPAADGVGALAPEEHALTVTVSSTL